MERVHKRKSIRLKEYDYSESGDYFTTICTKDFKCLFGKIIDGEMVLNEVGEIVKNEWLKTPLIRPNVELDEFCVMPNHIHMIITIVERSCRGVLQYAPTGLVSPSQTVGAIIRGFKSTTAKQINILRNTPGFPVWQRNYYEYIIRGVKDLDKIRDYIISNPGKWGEDRNNPKNIKDGK
ncbi:MAG: hypothetical protein UX62_C0043G0002 [Microgenomates group bacterium GW2011_GWA2_46_7]|nr:MAG: hypothetical protein UX62_C0043G0002 [Microgenomates group bacterium GW2011_GWA2_46_7]